MPDWLRKIMGSSETPKPITFTADVAIQAAEAPAEGEEPKRPTFAIHAYTGASMRVAGYYTPVILDIAGIKASRKALPILFNHDPSRVLGMATEVTINAEGIKLAGTITNDDDDAKSVIGNAKNGFQWQASIGANPIRVERLEAGKTTTINGRSVSGPMLIARESELYETSFVAIGADQNTSAAVAASNIPGKDTDMTFDAWLKAKGISIEGMADSAIAVIRAAFHAEQKPVEDDKPVEGTVDHKAMRGQHAAELRRIDAIQNAAKGHPVIAAKAIEEGWTTEKTELEVLRAARPSSGSTRQSPSVASDDVRVAAMAITAGFAPATVAASLPEAEREKTMNIATSGPMRGYGLHAAMDDTIRAAGQSYAGSRTSNEFIRAAFEADRAISASGSGFSTVGLGNLLNNLANKSLMRGYTAASTAWQQIAATRSHSNFKPHTRVRLDSSGGFTKVGPDGELKHISLSDATYTNQVETFGMMIALTRQMMINDDLNAFLELPAHIGRLAALRIEEEVFSLLLGNAGSFFGVANGNYKAGTATALGIDGLTAAEQLFFNMVDSDGKPILVSPDRMLVPTTLRVTAGNLMRDQFIIDGTATAKQTSGNPHVGKYAVVTSTYLNNTAIKNSDGGSFTGQSDKAWYLFADPANRAAIAVAFLNGQSGPIIESADTDFNTLGMQWRAYTDFGVAFEEVTGAIKLKGEN
jgi:phage head maturation protease/phage major head subunit gpT-like protein